MPSKESNDATSALWRASGMGAEFAFGIVGMILLGWLIDRWLDSGPVGILVGAGLGIVGGGYNFIRQAQKMNRQAAAQYRRNNPTPTQPEASDDNRT